MIRIKDIPNPSNGGNHVLWLDKEDGEHYITSFNPGGSLLVPHPECLLFKADEEGEIASFSELVNVNDPHGQDWHDYTAKKFRYNRLY